MAVPPSGHQRSYKSIHNMVVALNGIVIVPAITFPIKKRRSRVMTIHKQSVDRMHVKVKERG